MKAGEEGRPRKPDADRGSPPPLRAGFLRDSHMAAFLPSEDFIGKRIEHWLPDATPDPVEG